MTTTNPPGPVGVTVTSSPPAALQVVGLVKSYGSTTVLRDITLDVRRGETLRQVEPVGVTGPRGVRQRDMARPDKPAAGVMIAVGHAYSPVREHEPAWSRRFVRFSRW